MKIDGLNPVYTIQPLYNRFDKHGLTTVLNIQRDCQTSCGCTTGLTTGCIHDTAVCQTACQTGLTIG